MTNLVTLDKRWESIVKYSELPGISGLFLLGSFARRVTVYSQHVRALNLVDALAGLGRVSPQTRVAVVGAGMGGLAVSGGLVSLGVPVTIYDSESVPMHLQKNSKERYLHPHIYDWPLRKLNEINADLPLLDWNADHAQQVAECINGKWEKLVEGKIEKCLGQKVHSLTNENRRWLLTAGHDATPRDFDVVVLALGYGIERNEGNSYPYWDNVGLSGRNTQDHSWFVSGGGDGALTDAVRLCVLNMDHGTIISRFVQSIEENLGTVFLDQLRTKVLNGEFGEGLFTEIDIAKRDKILGKFSLRTEPIILNATTGSVFGLPGRPPRSSTLNRMMVWILMNCSDPKIELREGRLPDENPILGYRGNFTVKIPGESKDLPIQEVLLRHGPERIRFEELIGSSSGRQIKRLREEWKALYEQNLRDHTLNTDWSQSAFSNERLSTDFSNWPAIVMSERKGDLTSLKNSMVSILRKNSIKAELAELLSLKCRLSGEFPFLSSDSVDDPRSFSKAVQDLARAPILVVDATSISPKMAFLLGLRAVVRRGITILFRDSPMNAATWQELPFNLREIRIVETRGTSSIDGFETPIRQAIEEGLRRLNRHPFHYEDLPGFDAIRTLGGHIEDTSPRLPSNEVLVLCPFDEEFDRNCWPVIQRGLQELYNPQNSPARRVTDLATPELLSRRLFESIRLDNVCVVDLTYTRSNVCFELGVRLASHKDGATIIRCVDPPQKKDSPQSIEMNASDFICKLFGCGEYSRDSIKTPLIVDALGGDSGGVLSKGFIFNLAQTTIEIAQEIPTGGMLSILWNCIASIGGVDRQKRLDYPILFGDNDALKSRATRFVFDGLLAFVLLGRYNSDVYRKDPRWYEAVADLKNLLNEIECSSTERAKLTQLIERIDSHDDS